jgi:hypothetical protein
MDLRVYARLISVVLLQLAEDKIHLLEKYQKKALLFSYV